MPDELDKYLAEQQEAELGEWDEHIKHRKELRAPAPARPRPNARDRASVVAELEAGSDELSEMDTAIDAQQNGPKT